MKNNRIAKSNDRRGLEAAVRLEFTHPTARSVSVAGSFNDWRPGATVMVPVGQGHWRKELMLPPGRYEYRLVVDDQWMPDPLARETTPNPFGGVNSVLNVTSSPAAKNGKRR